MTDNGQNNGLDADGNAVINGGAVNGNAVGNSASTSATPAPSNGNGSSISEQEFAQMKRELMELRAAVQRPRALDKHYDVAKKQLLKFTGNKGDVSWENWLDSFFQVGTNLDWDEEDFLSMLPGLLREKAKDTFFQIPLAQRRDWNVVKAKFDVVYGRQNTFGLDVNLLFAYVQKDDQTVEDYGSEQGRLVYNAFPDQDESLNQGWRLGLFVNGLKSGLRGRVWDRVPETYEEAFRYAQQAQALYELGRKGKPEKGNAERSPKKNNFGGKWQKGHQHDNSGRRTPTNGSEGDAPGEAAKYSAADRTAWPTSSMICSNCRQPNHISRNCTAPKQSPNPGGSISACTGTGGLPKYTGYLTAEEMARTPKGEVDKCEYIKKITGESVYGMSEFRASNGRKSPPKTQRHDNVPKKADAAANTPRYPWVSAETRRVLGKPRARPWPNARPKMVAASTQTDPERDDGLIAKRDFCSNVMPNKLVEPATVGRSSHFSGKAALSEGQYESDNEPAQSDAANETAPEIAAKRHRRRRRRRTNRRKRSEATAVKSAISGDKAAETNDESAWTTDSDGTASECYFSDDERSTARIPAAKNGKLSPVRVKFKR